MNRKYIFFILWIFTFVIVPIIASQPAFQVYATKLVYFILLISSSAGGIFLGVRENKTAPKVIYFLIGGLFGLAAMAYIPLLITSLGP